MTSPKLAKELIPRAENEASGFVVRRFIALRSLICKLFVKLVLINGALVVQFEKKIAQKLTGIFSKRSHRFPILFCRQLLGGSAPKVHHLIDQDWSVQSRILV
jgi:hypothetical protein